MRILQLSIVRDEGPYLLEWIAHHRALGVTDFLIFSHDCFDGTDALLDALEPAGVQHERLDIEPGRSPQWQALRQAGEHPAFAAAEWVLGIDADEFVTLAPPLSSLAELIESVAPADAIALPWRLFGFAGNRRLEDRPVTESFLRAAPERCLYPADASHFKTLWRQRAFRQAGVHRPRNRNMARHGVPRWVDGSGRPLGRDFAAADARIMLWGQPIANALVQLNHYSLRSAQGFMIKRARGLPNRSRKAVDLRYWVERNFNTVEEPSALRHRQARAEVQAELLALEGVAGLHHEAFRRHRQRFIELVRNPDELALYGRLLLARDSTPPEPDLVEELVALYRAAEGEGRRGRT